VNGDLTIDPTGFSNGGGYIEMQAQLGPATLTAGGVTFNDLTLNAPNGTFNMAAGESFNVAGTFKALGGAPSQMTLQSTVATMQWLFNPMGPRMIDEVSVRDSNNTGMPILVNNWVDQGNNMGWMTAPNFGYFVLTDVVGADGAFGGLAGADSLCEAELMGKLWMGKTEAMGRGILTMANIRPFLCEDASCLNPQPTTQYKFASIPNGSAGGMSFTSDGSGAGPFDTAVWGMPGHFGDVGGPPGNEVWTGRITGGPSTIWSVVGPGGGTCNNWANAGGTAYVGRVDIAGGATRWANTPVSCGMPRRLICMVDP
jgi:hypothetical protein